MKPDQAPTPKNLEKHELGPQASLAEVLDYSDGLTRERNRTYFPTLDKRVIHLYSGGVEMFDTVRAKAKSEGVIPIVASKILLRALNVLQALDNLGEVIDRLMKKFPASGCSYCGKKPCQCAVIRPEDKVGAKSSEEQRTWSLIEWQHHLKSVYGESNHGRGLDWIANRLGSEIGELSEAAILMEKYKETNPEKSKENKDEAASEAADVVAWAMAVCNEINADIGKAFADRYGKGCPNCKQYPCKCGEFSHKQERKVLKDM